MMFEVGDTPAEPFCAQRSLVALAPTAVPLVADLIAFRASAFDLVF